MKAEFIYLSTCDTCRKILREVSQSDIVWQLRDIKSNPLTDSEIDELAKNCGSYELLVNKRATLWKEQKLSEKQLTEQDYRELLLQHYTFLKRPIARVNGINFIGNDRKTTDALKHAIGL